MHQLSDFDFHLAPELIAQHPANERTASRLLLIEKTDHFRDLQFKDLLNQLHAGDVLVFNNSKVIPARLYGQKETGGQVEILVERITGEHTATAMLRVSKKPAPGALIHLNAPRGPADLDTAVTVLGRDPEHDDRFILKFNDPVLPVLHAYGEIPLPPYIEHQPNAQDAIRYQTVYAQTPGSVAAPTAGLHFDESFLSALDAKGIERAFVTLHVGTGTFAPVRTEDISQHRMHSEWCEIPKATAELILRAKQAGKRVIAVGTTSLRTLESCAGNIRSGSWETNIFIRPGYEFKTVDALLTNFHLPKSTLLMLVAAFIGYDRMRLAYAHAIDQRYRFFSYGDAMFCLRAEK